MRVFRLDVAPLMAVMKVRGYRVGCGSRSGANQHTVPVSINSLPTKLHRAYHRAVKQGWISLRQADELAVALGMHPIEIWGWDFYEVEAA